MMDRPAPPSPARSNIETVARLEEELEREHGLVQRLGAAIGDFSGTLAFVAFECVAVALWIVANSSMVPGIPAFDPFPFPLLGALSSLQCVFLTAFVLIRQKQMGRVEERRSYLDLQVNLLAERETTKIIQMLERLGRQLGIEDRIADPETRALGESTTVEGLADELGRQLADETDAEDGARDRPPAS